MLFKGQLYLENTGRILPKGVGWKSVNLSQCGPVADFAKYDQRRLSPLKTPQEKKKNKTVTEQNAMLAKHACGGMVGVLERGIRKSQAVTLQLETTN